MVESTEKELEKAVIEITEDGITINDFVPLDDEESKEKFNPHHEPAGAPGGIGGRFAESPSGGGTQQELPLLEDVEIRPDFNPKNIHSLPEYEDDVSSGTQFLLYREEMAENANMLVDEWQDEMTNRLEIELEDALIAVRVDPLDLESILDDGRFKSQHETGTTEGFFDPEYRKEMEDNVWGEHSYRNTEWRPIYGYITESTDRSPEDVFQYGSAEVILKRSNVENRTTFVVGDSLGAIERRNAVPRPITSPDHSAVDANPGWPDARFSLPDSPGMFFYWEAQIHGGVTLDDVSVINFTGRVDPALLRKLDDLGINHLEQ